MPRNPPQLCPSQRPSVPRPLEKRLPQVSAKPRPPAGRPAAHSGDTLPTPPHGAGMPLRAGSPQPHGGGSASRSGPGRRRPQRGGRPLPPRPPAASLCGEAALEGSARCRRSGAAGAASSRAGSGAHGMSDGGFLPGHRFGKGRSALPAALRGAAARGGRGALRDRCGRSAGLRGSTHGTRAPRGSFPLSPGENRSRATGPGLRPAKGCRVSGTGQPPMAGGGCEGPAAHGGV